MNDRLDIEVDLYNALKASGIDKPKILMIEVWIGTNLLAPNVAQYHDNDFVSKVRDLIEDMILNDKYDRMTHRVYRHIYRTMEELKLGAQHLR